MVQALRHQAENNGDNSTGKIDRDGMDLSGGGGVAESLEDGRLKVCQRVCVFRHAQVHGDTAYDQHSLVKDHPNNLPSPDLPVAQFAEDILDRNTIMSIVTSLLHAPQHQLLLLTVQEIAMLRERRHKEPTPKRNRNRKHTLNDKNPPPRTIPLQPIHFRNQTANKPIHRPSNNSRCQKNHIASQILGGSVVRANQVRRARNESRFTDSLKQARDDELLPRADEAAADDCDGPEEHHHAEGFWAVFLEGDGAGDTGNKVAKVEDPDADVEALAGEVKFFFHAGDFGVADLGRGWRQRGRLRVLMGRGLGDGDQYLELEASTYIRSIDKIAEVEDPEDGDDAEVELADEAPLSGAVDGLDMGRRGGQTWGGSCVCENGLLLRRERFCRHLFGS